MRPRRRRALATALPLCLALGARAAGAQSDTTHASADSARAVVAPRTDSTAHRPAPAAPAGPTFGATLFANYQYHDDAASRAAGAGHNPNRFDVERVYLTARLPAGERALVRITTDVFQQPDSTRGAYYRGWTMRLKYAYLQYDVARDIAGRRGFDATARLGMVHTIVIEHEESFWPRYVAQTAVDRSGFFFSADAGVAGLVTLPGRRGEVYAHVTNGSGFVSSETDRFKDAALRLTLTPFAADSTSPLRSFTISPWGYAGAAASRFQAGGVGQQGAIGGALARDRWGVFTGVRGRRFTAGAEWAARVDGVEGGENTAALPRTVHDRTGRLLDAFAVARPLEWARPGRPSSLGILARVDHFRPDVAAAGTVRFVVAGLFWEPTPRTAFALDYQGQTPRGAVGAPELHTIFLHWSATL